MQGAFRFKKFHPPRQSHTQETFHIVLTCHRICNNATFFLIIITMRINTNIKVQMFRDFYQNLSTDVPSRSSTMFRVWRHKMFETPRLKAYVTFQTTGKCLEPHLRFKGNQYVVFRIKKIGFIDSWATKSFFL